MRCGEISHLARVATCPHIIIDSHEKGPRMTMIELTTHMEDKVWFNTDLIETITRREDLTYIFMSGDAEEAWRIKETPQEIFHKIRFSVNGN